MYLWESAYVSTVFIMRAGFKSSIAELRVLRFPKEVISTLQNFHSQSGFKFWITEHFWLEISFIFLLFARKNWYNLKQQQLYVFL